MKSGSWFWGFLLIIAAIFVFSAVNIYQADPFFHYHAPLTDKYFYYLDNERMQNDGIVKNFDYDALLTGSSLTENFKTSELDRLFGVTSVKVPFSGGSWKEINDNVLKAISENKNLKMVVRGLDENYFGQDKDQMNDEYEYPTYLYNKNPFDDVKYLLNHEVLFGRVFRMYLDSKYAHYVPGVTAFDDYAVWQGYNSFGREAVMAHTFNSGSQKDEVPFTDQDKSRLLDNIHQNLTTPAAEHPEIVFYYFFPPYSAEAWRILAEEGEVKWRFAAQKVIIEELLKYDNIKLFSFDDRTDITTDLNHYKDTIHFGEWINSLILYCMRIGKNQLTQENYLEYLEKTEDFYTNYDYDLLSGQEDLADDSDKAAEIYEEIYGGSLFSVPLAAFDADMLQTAEFRNAEITADVFNGKDGIHCSGTLNRPLGSPYNLAEYMLWNDDYCGFKFTLDDASPYGFLTFYGRKDLEKGQPMVFVFDEDDRLISEFIRFYYWIDDEWHRYILDLHNAEGKVTILFNGGYVDVSAAGESAFTFSNIELF